MAFLTFTLFERPAREYLRGRRSKPQPALEATEPDTPAIAYSEASE